MTTLHRRAAIIEDLDYFADWVDPVPELNASADRIVRNEVMWIAAPGRRSITKWTPPHIPVPNPEVR